MVHWNLQGVLYLEHTPQDSPLNAGQMIMEFWNILIPQNKMNALTTNIPTHQTHITKTKIKGLSRDEVPPGFQHGQWIEIYWESMGMFSCRWQFQTFHRVKSTHFSPSSLSMLNAVFGLDCWEKRSLGVKNLSSRIILLPCHLMYHPITHLYTENTL